MRPKIMFCIINKRYQTVMCILGDMRGEYFIPWLDTYALLITLPVARIPRKAVGPIYIGRVIPEYVIDPRAPVDKSRVLILGVTTQIPELLRIAVKLHRHHYR